MIHRKSKKKGAFDELREAFDEIGKALTPPKPKHTARKAVISTAVISGLFAAAYALNPKKDKA